MRYAGLLKNDFINGQGVCVSFWTQGCPYHCEGCHNPQTWDFCGGRPVDEEELTKEIIKSINANGIQRNLSILGGEPLCDENIGYIYRLVNTIRIRYPNIKIFLWTGMTEEEIKEDTRPELATILSVIDTIVVGRFILKERDISLPLRGSRNQKVINLKK